MVDHRVTGSNLIMVGLGGDAGTEPVVDVVAAVTDRHGPSTRRGRAVGAGAVEGGSVVDDDVARLNDETYEAGVVNVDGGDRCAFGAGERFIGYEPVWAVDEARSVRAAEVGHGTRVDGHRVEWNPGGADAVTFEVEVAEVLVEGRGLGGAGFLDQHRVLVEVDAFSVHQGGGDGRKGRGGGKGGEGRVVEPVVDARQETTRPGGMGLRISHDGSERRHVGGDHWVSDRGLHRFDEEFDPLGGEDGREVDDAVTHKSVDLVIGDRPERLGGWARHGAGCYSSSSGAAAGASSSSGDAAVSSAGASSLAAHRNLREVHPEALDRLAEIGGALSDLVVLHRALVERLEPIFHDEYERAVVAAARIADGSVDLPPVVLHLPGTLVASERRLVGALATTGHLTAIVGDADSPDGSVSANPHLAALTETLDVDAPEAGPAGSRVACLVASTPEQDESVRYAIRRIIEAARAGTPLDRMVLVHPSTTDDARLVQERLTAAGIEFHASGVHRLDETIAGRFLIGLLDLPDRGIRRTDLDALMADVPLWDPDHDLVPARAWGRLAAQAGVVSGIDEWTDRLAHLAAELDAEAVSEVDDEGRTWLADRLSAEATRARQLAAFVERLCASLHGLTEDDSWAGRCRRVRDLLRQYLGGTTAHESWSADELLALDEVGAILDALSELDNIEPHPPYRSFRGALAAELGRPIGRAGRSGIGVQVTGIDQAVGLDADLVIVVGLAEGSMPTRPPADPLLSDDHRTAARTGLPTRHEHAARQHHAFLAALTGAAERIVLVQPRGDLRRSGDRPMSRLLLAEFEELAGHRPESDDLDLFVAPWFDHVASFTDALDRDDPATVQEYDLATAIRGGRPAVDKLRCDDVVVDRGIELLGQRADKDFTRFDGNLSGVTLPVLDGELSATRLEKWVDCPFAFFAEYVLGVRPLEDPSERTGLSPLIRGSIVHRVLDRLVTDGLANGSLPGHGDPWTAAQRAHAAELLNEECAHAEARGEAAHPRF